VLEPDRDVVGVPDDDDIAGRVAFAPRMGPGVERVVQVDVCEQRRSGSPNAGGNFEFEVTLELVRRSPKLR